MRSSKTPMGKLHNINVILLFSNFLFKFLLLEFVVHLHSSEWEVVPCCALSFCFYSPGEPVTTALCFSFLTQHVESYSLTCPPHLFSQKLLTICPALLSFFHWRLSRGLCCFLLLHCSVVFYCVNSSQPSDRICYQNVFCFYFAHNYEKCFKEDPCVLLYMWANTMMEFLY